jgi:RNA polymerase sigma-70 factor (ECF subfamily)
MEPSELPGLIERFSRGDSRAAERLLRHAMTISLRTAAAVLSSRDQARDVSQDVAVDVIRGIDKLDAPERFDAWVHRITVRKTMRALRARRRAEHDELPTGQSMPGSGLAMAAADRAVIRAAIAELPERQRIAIALKYVHGLSSAEIADALDCRVGTVDSLLSRARSLLRRNPMLADFEPNGGSIA